jgi:hypothetical protein
VIKRSENAPIVSVADFCLANDLFSSVDLMVEEHEIQYQFAPLSNYMRRLPLEWRVMQTRRSVRSGASGQRFA